VGFELPQVPTALKPAIYLGFWVVPRHVV